MVSADVSNDDNVSKGKREASIAEPSTGYLPPRLEAPYATYQPITVGGNAPTAQYFQSTPFNQHPSAAPAASPAYEYNRNSGFIPLQTVENNNLGNEIYSRTSYNINPGPSYDNNIYGVSGAYTESNSYGGVNSYGSFVKYGQDNVPVNYGPSNGQSLKTYNGGNGFENNAGHFEQYSTIKNSHFDNDVSNVDSSFYRNQAGSGEGVHESKYPTSAALLSNPPSYASGVKGLGHYKQSIPVSNLNTHTETQAVRNSRPVAITSAHLTRKQPSFLSEPKNSNFRPSFLLGSQVLPSTSVYNQQFNQQLSHPFTQPSTQQFTQQFTQPLTQHRYQPPNQPTSTSLGTTNEYLPPTQTLPEQYQVPEQYSAPPSFGEIPLTQREYLPPSTSNFVNSYQASVQPMDFYGLPKTSLYGERYGPPQ